MSHTPGPWSPYFYTRNQRLKLGDWLFLRDDGHHPVPLNGTRREVPESAANARLIAAAPEMLAALIEAYTAITYMMSNEDCGGASSALDQVIAAIAKAEGRE